MFRKYSLILLLMVVLQNLLMAQEGIQVQYWQNINDKFGGQAAFGSGTWLGLSYRDDYCLKELMNVDASGVVMMGYNALNMQVSHYGYGKYGELVAKIGYARNFGGKIGVGMNFYYLYSHVAGYESIHSVSFDLSIYATVTKRLSFGFDVFNPARLKYGVIGKEVIPMDFRLVALFQYNAKLLFSLKGNLKLPGAFNVELAAYYVPLPYFGLSFDVSLKSAGLDILLQYRNVSFQIRASYNYKLGFSPGLSVVYHFQQKKK